MAEDIKNTEATEVPNGNFIHTFIEEDIAEGGRFEGKKVHTRFPPALSAFGCSRCRIGMYWSE